MRSSGGRRDSLPLVGASEPSHVQQHVPLTSAEPSLSDLRFAGAAETSNASISDDRTRVCFLQKSVWLSTQSIIDDTLVWVTSRSATSGTLVLDKFRACNTFKL